MGARIKANFICHFKGYWRKTGFYPVVFICALAWFAGFYDSSIEFHERWSSFHGLTEIVAFLLILLMGLAHGKDERERKIVLRTRSLPHRYAEEFTGSWLALLVYVLLTVLLSTLVYSAINFSSAMNLLSSRPVSHLSSDAKVTETQREYIFERKHGQVNDKQSFAFVGYLMAGDKPNGESAAVIPAYWRNGEEREDIDIKLYVARTSYVPLSEKGFKELVVPKGQAVKGVELWIPEFFLHSTGLSFFGSFSGFLFNLFLRMLIFACIITAIGKKMALETGVFIVIAFLAASFVFSKMGDDVVDHLMEKADRYEQFTTGYKEYWWERSMLEYSKFISKYISFLPDLVKPSQDIQFLKDYKWVTTPFESMKVLKTFVLMFVFALLTIPLSRTRIP